MGGQIEKDIKEIVADENIPWEKLDGRTVLVTGATGLLGKLTVKVLIQLREYKDVSVHVIANVRNKEKAETIFKEEIERYSEPECMVSDVRCISEISESIDYIIHAAGETASRAFVERPVEVAETALFGTDNLLQIARDKHIKNMVFLSTMEVYGTPDDDEKIYEDRILPVNPSLVRNSYPISKIACESLCISYGKEYRVPVDIIRLTQTFGAGVDIESDNRVFAEFARNAVQGKDIVLKTAGETKRSYLYTTDAVRGILTVLLRKKDDNSYSTTEIYNAANEDTYCSIAEMAKLVITSEGSDTAKVILNAEKDDKSGYAPTLCMNLSSDKLRGLGWKATIGLEEMYRRLCVDMREHSSE